MLMLLKLLMLVGQNRDLVSLCLSQCLRFVNDMTAVHFELRFTHFTQELWKDLI